MFKKKFYYGDGTDHVVKLTQKMADAVIKCRFKDVKVVGESQDGKDDIVIMKTNLTREEMNHYNKGVSILNRYHDKHGAVTWKDESKPYLRPVKK